MNAAGIDFVCIGNHENDVSFDQLQARMKQSNFTWVNSNMVWSTPLKEGITTPEYAIVEVGKGTHKRKVALIGLNTDDRSILREGAFGGASIEPVIPTAQKLIRRLVEQEGVDLVVPLTHQIMPLDRTFVEATLGLGTRLVLGAHDHQPYLAHYADEQWSDLLASKRSADRRAGCTVVKTGMDATMFGICDITWESAASKDPVISVTLRDAKEYSASAEVSAAIARHKRVLEELDKSCLCAITPEQALSSEKMRLQPTTMGVFLSNVVRDALEADCTLFGAGGIRANHNYAGELNFTYAHLKAEIPFPTEMIVAKLSGQCISDAISYTRAFALQNPPVEKGGYLQTDDRIVWDAATNTVTHIAGEPIDLTRIYGVAMNRMNMQGLDDIKPLVVYKDTDEYKKNNASAGTDGSEQQVQNLEVDIEGLDMDKEADMKKMQAYEAALHPDNGIGAKELIVGYFCKQIWYDILSEYDFDEIDKDRSGYIDKEELYAIAKKKMGDTNQDVSNMMVDNLFSIADESGDNRISRAEILNLAYSSSVLKVVI